MNLKQTAQTLKMYNICCIFPVQMMEERTVDWMGEGIEGRLFEVQGYAHKAWIQLPVKTVHVKLDFSL